MLNKNARCKKMSCLSLSTMLGLFATRIIDILIRASIAVCQTFPGDSSIMCLCLNSAIVISYCRAIAEIEGIQKYHLQNRTIGLA